MARLADLEALMIEGIKEKRLATAVRMLQIGAKKMAKNSDKISKKDDDHRAQVLAFLKDPKEEEINHLTDHWFGDLKDEFNVYKSLCHADLIEGKDSIIPETQRDQIMRDNGLTQRNAIVAVLMSTIVIIVVFVFLIVGMSMFAEGDAFSSAITSFLGATAGLAINVRSTVESGNASAVTNRIVKRLVAAWANQNSRGVNLRDNLNDAVDRRIKHIQQKNTAERVSKRKKSIMMTITTNDENAKNANPEDVERLNQNVATEAHSKLHGKLHKRATSNARILRKESTNARTTMKEKTLIRIRDNKFRKNFKKIALFQECTDQQQRALIGGMVEKNYEKGQNIITYGHPADEFMMIMDGEIVVFSESGEEITRMGKHDHFGERALLPGTHTRGATVQAVTNNVAVLVLRRSHYEKMFKDGNIDEKTQNHVLKVAAKYDKEDAERNGTMVDDVNNKDSEEELEIIQIKD